MRLTARPSAAAHLVGFKGVLQVDGYAGYRPLAETGDIRLAFCWAHVRRRFYELAAAGPAPIASEALERIASLYAVESDIRGQAVDARRRVRQEHSRPIIEALHAWLKAQLERVSQKGKLAEAIRYALARWDGLSLFLGDGRVEIDSSAPSAPSRSTARTPSSLAPMAAASTGPCWPR
jgi:transposase